MTEIPLDASFELGASKQVKTLAFLKNGKGKSLTAEEISSAIGAKEGAEMVFKFLERPAANVDHPVKKIPPTYHFVRSINTARSSVPNPTGPALGRNRGRRAGIGTYFFFLLTWRHLPFFRYI
jgi:hypothetical protein